MSVSFSPSRPGKMHVVVLGRNITESLLGLFSSRGRKWQCECSSAVTIEASYGPWIPCALLNTWSSLSSPSPPHGKYGWMSSWEQDRFLSSKFPLEYLCQEYPYLFSQNLPGAGFQAVGLYVFCIYKTLRFCTKITQMLHLVETKHVCIYFLSGIIYSAFDNHEGALLKFCPLNDGNCV